MTKYRDLLTDMYDAETGSVVGCALDRLDRLVSHHEQTRAVEFFRERKSELDALPLSARRDRIAEFIATGAR